MDVSSSRVTSRRAATTRGMGRRHPPSAITPAQKPRRMACSGSMPVAVIKTSCRGGGQTRVRRRMRAIRNVSLPSTILASGRQLVAASTPATTLSVPAGPVTVNITVNLGGGYGGFRNPARRLSAAGCGGPKQGQFTIQPSTANAHGAIGCLDFHVTPQQHRQQRCYFVLSAGAEPECAARGLNNRAARPLVRIIHKFVEPNL
jgi:hypothetical protein